MCSEGTIRNAAAQALTPCLFVLSGSSQFVWWEKVHWLTVFVRVLSCNNDFAAFFLRRSSSFLLQKSFDVGIDCLK